ncbi:hypothetical protein D9615_008464 [Tricholomella constricta]|uniref:Uncharacterized protein n=1 Tax=Tricholomella constricta TaxID=117010 RepID=A0A8H5M0G8_9AGAR|nr:hypothetical protein D9615_008464 [Tricholomella constricta]
MFRVSCDDHQSASPPARTWPQIYPSLSTLFSFMGCVQSSNENTAMLVGGLRSLMTGNTKTKTPLRPWYEDMKDVKVVLLGGMGSGKVSDRPRYTTTERDSHKEIIFSNLVSAMQAFIATSNITLSPSARYSGTDWPSNPFVGASLPNAVVDDIRVLLNEPEVKKAIATFFKSHDNAIYFLDSLDRISAPEYMPTNEDILRSRVLTTGITETKFAVGPQTYRVFDVGGSRSERKKWINCFVAVDALIFLASVSDYDQTLYEDASVLRMQESLTLFDSLCHSQVFLNIPMIIVLNKMDLLAEKLRHSPLIEYFPDFKGGTDCDAACEYILHRCFHKPRSEPRETAHLGILHFRNRQQAVDKYE